MLTRPAILLRVEESMLLGAAIAVYAHFHFSWILFAVLFFVPDVSMLGYLVNPRIGAALYNVGHTLSVPLGLIFFALLGGHGRLVAICLIWLAHIAFDRLMGYGLKYPARFKDTHLQHIP